ncbi:hypothetical protein [Parasphingorhabdus pacifica]
MDPETPEADAAEQARQAEDDVDEEEATAVGPGVTTANANPADFVEQQQIVPDDDSYDWS